MKQLIIRLNFFVTLQNHFVTLQKKYGQILKLMPYYLCKHHLTFENMTKILQFTKTNVKLKFIMLLHC